MDIGQDLMRLWWSDGGLDEEPLGGSCMGGRENKCSELTLQPLIQGFESAGVIFMHTNVLECIAEV
jgi:hypothetical protein